MTKTPPILAIVPDNQLKKLSEENYTFRDSVMRAEGQYAGSNQLRLVDYPMTENLNEQALNTHIELKRNKLLVRIHFNKVLHNLYHLPKILQPAMISRIKTLSPAWILLKTPSL